MKKVIFLSFFVFLGTHVFSQDIAGNGGGTLHIEDTTLNRPQTPAKPYPYIEEEVTILNKKDNISLSGTLTLPGRDSIYPAVILIAGSGPNDRDETIFGHKPFLVLSDYLTRNGFAVLRYDKRGVGRSTGDYKKATTADFASDAKEAIAYLQTRKEIDKNHIGLIGHSEGGVVASMVASESKDVKFIVLLASMGVKGNELLSVQNITELKRQNVDPETIVGLIPHLKDALKKSQEWESTENDSVSIQNKLSKVWSQLPTLFKLRTKKENFIRSTYNAMISPWLRQFLSIDPANYLEKTSCPVLAINGEKDTQVLADKNLTAIETALEKGGNNQYTIKKYPNLNHLFQVCETGDIDEYAKIEQTISPEVLEDITKWVKAQLK
jgi:fermentation-respiration switch protein FrsA (DUF1100 family)